MAPPDLRVRAIPDSPGLAALLVGDSLRVWVRVLQHRDVAAALETEGAQEVGPEQESLINGNHALLATYVVEPDSMGFAHGLAVFYPRWRERGRGYIGRGPRRPPGTLVGIEVRRQRDLEWAREVLDALRLADGYYRYYLQ